jgi:hypothetical protein
MSRRRDTRLFKEFYRVRGSDLSMRRVPGSTNQSEQIFRKRGNKILVRGLVGELTLASVFSLGRDAMRNSVDIDSGHSRAIVKKIGERLRESFKKDRELPVSFQKQIERLRQSESEARSSRRLQRGDKS